MIKVLSCKCIILTLFCLTPSLCADKNRSLNLKIFENVPKVKSKNHKKDILDKVNEFIGDDIDLTLFDKRKLGWSMYAKISKVSRLGVRYNY